jgi:hypothetical protein
VIILRNLFYRSDLAWFELVRSFFASRSADFKRNYDENALALVL